MKRFDVQGIQLGVPADKAFAYIADDAHLPEWTHAFASVDGARAIMRTPNGEVPVELAALADRTRGTIDWRMTFPDGSSGLAHSRVVPLDDDACVYVFVLAAPPVPLEALEGTLAEQARTLAEELRTLKRILEHDGR
ncbi:MAG TPA: SRPBCC family protein [Candidatus Krumholzibacteria bacterium]|nr:SRPBCC family protein [Candidatus Krumholzibacteria bacterium]